MRAPVILCIEDEPSLREDIAAELVDAGYAVIQAADAPEALDALAGQRPDLILCDIVMPGLDGHALLAHLRARRPDLSDVPFVFLTALSSREQMIEGRRAGADDYLTKPIDYGILRAVVAARLDQVERLRTARGHGVETDALDHLTVGIVLLDAAGDVCHANRAARDLAQGAGIGLQPRLNVTGDDGRRLSALVTRILSGGESSAALWLNGGPRRVMLLGRALAPGPGVPGVAAMLTLSDPDRQEGLNPGALQQLFDLTPTEAAVARLVAEGHRRDEIAARLRVSPNTVAFHLRNIFDKTGTRRQAELVALVLSMPMAWHGP